MSYSICRIKKFKASGVTGIQIHDRREKKVSHTNKDINWEKSSENIDLLNQKEKFRTVIKNRINELNLPRAVRSDATVMVQSLITSDSAFFEKMNRTEQLNFFKHSYDFIKNRYGEKNMISAIIHFDETTPHMHINFVPVTSDGRLSARDLFGPKDLVKLQDDYHKHCVEGGYKLERGKMNTKKRGLSVQEFKLETKSKELQEKEIEINNKLKELEAQKDIAKSDLNVLRNDLRHLHDIKVEFNYIDSLKGKYGLLNKNKITVNAEDFEKLKNIAKRQHVLEGKIEMLERSNASLSQDLSKFRGLDLQSRNFEREKKIRGMVKDLDTVKDYLTKKNLLEDFKQFKEQQKQLQKNLNRGLGMER